MLNQTGAMILNRLKALFTAIVLLFAASSQAQVSQGGIPLKTSKLKSSRKSIVEMPPFDKFLVQDDATILNQAENQLKPFQFAYPFEVNFTTENSGEWYQAEDGFMVWKLTIRSAGAKSINLIFEDFELMERERLFLYSEPENHTLGAFTSVNNLPHKKFAVSPVLGEEITVQYEIPEENFQYNHFKITRVNHDYVGILKSGSRRPLGKTAGSCNIDINCDNWKSWGEVKNSVCRVFVNGKEVCTGVLVNNTAENQKPYVLSQAHCYDRKEYAQTTVYTFNYESPMCAPLDGDPSNSISGAVMKAQHDSLDFALVELSMVPPPSFRTYYAGWELTAELPASSVSITHPWGDIKKVAYDNDAPVISNFEQTYTKNGFLKILRWDGGVTESGSSGGPLFSPDKRLIGTLTGGQAVCGNPVNDYFARFNMAWDYRADSTKQLKHWLDPKKSEIKILDGKQFYEGKQLCGAFTNLGDADKYSLIPVTNENKFAGYWGGSNSIGITEIMEHYSIEGNEILSGVSLGVGKFKSKVTSNNSEITLKVYNGIEKPEQLIYSQVVKTSQLAQDAMNFIGFSEEVKPGNSFFVGFELTNIQPLDSFAVYQSLRAAGSENLFYLKQHGTWYNFTDTNPAKKAMANIFELVACNIDDFSTDTPMVENPKDILVYPNPSQSTFMIEAGQDIPENTITVFNVLGQKNKVKTTRINERKVSIDLTGNVPGVYFIRFDTGDEIISRKISFVPW